MELYNEIFAKLVAEYILEILKQSPFDFSGQVETECYKALRKIRDILKNEDNSDEECFARIEEIVGIYEELGSDCGSRHDFS